MAEQKRTENLAADELSLDELNSVAGGTKTAPTPKKTTTAKSRLFEVEDYSFDIEQT
jgi:hypothetical protein